MDMVGPLEGTLAVWLAVWAIAAATAAGAWIVQRRRRATRDAGPAAAPVTQVAHPRDRFARGLAKSRALWTTRLRDSPSPGLDRTEALGRVEQILLEADVGVRSTERLLDRLRAHNVGEEKSLAAGLREEMRALLGERSPEPSTLPARPWVVLVVGINGVGKTTTIGKLASRHRAAGRSVMLVAGDTFRAAAADQLAIWAERVGAQLVRQSQGTDPSAVVYDGVTAAAARSIDVVLVDTAGRLHTKVNLMEELKKISRVAARALPGAPHEVLLVLDATTGQNALSQARTFADAVGVAGVVLTKLDGSARGGVAIGVREEIGLPIRYVGLGEGAEDLQPFDPDAFLEGLLSEG